MNTDEHRVFRMMKLSFPVAAVVSVLLTAGCATPSAERPAEPTFEERLRHAGILMDTGQPRLAIRAFADVRDHCGDPRIRQRAVLGTSAALQASGDAASAIGALMPLPLSVATETDARHYAMAGELYLRKKAHETAASYLETALAYKGDGGTWRPAALFNLGKCALALGVPHKAKKLFEEAKPAFDDAGDSATARRCAAILADLGNVLPSAKEKIPDAQ
jgi:tetratricopeptide (TPR) repeat protein